jgi:cyclophilin family peptidyl-prolyl cis-trans isomerase
VNEERAGGVDRRLIILAVFALIAVGAVAAVLIGRSGGDDDGDGGGAETAAGCEQVEKPPPKDVRFDAPPQTVKRGEQLTAVVSTSCGDFEIDLDTERAPKTVNSFVFLARKNFFDDQVFHRIAPGFVIQGGDPKGTGIGGPGYKVDEPPPANLAYLKGVVAMAKSMAEPPGRSGSQFFVVTGVDAGLPPQYALLGKVPQDGGLDVVERIGRLGTPQQKPKQTVVIDDVTIENR